MEPATATRKTVFFRGTYVAAAGTGSDARTYSVHTYTYLLLSAVAVSGFRPPARTQQPIRGG
jgi:hypothetical protein